MAIVPELIPVVEEAVAAGEAAAPTAEEIFASIMGPAEQGALWAGRLAVCAVLILALIISYAITLLLRALAAVFGFVPLVGGWIRDNIVNVGVSAIGAVTGWVTGSLGSMIGFVWAPIRWIGAVFARILEALWEAGEMGVRILTHALPTWAGAIQTWVQGLINDVRSWVDGYIKLVQGWVQGLINDMRSWVDGYIKLVQGWVRQLLDLAIAGVTLRIGQVITWAQQNFHRLDQDVINGVRTAEDYATRVGQGVTTHLEREIQTRVQPLEDKLKNCEQDMCATINEAKRLQNTTDFLPIDPVPVGWVLEAAFSARATAAEAVTFALPLVEAITAAVRSEFQR